MEWGQSGYDCLLSRYKYGGKEIFKVIGDDLGVYLDHDRTYQDTSCLALACIPVHLDTREGLVESYLLQMGDITRRQILDYEGIPFHYRKCHEVGHLYKHCPRISRQNWIPPKHWSQPPLKLWIRTSVLQWTSKKVFRPLVRLRSRPLLTNLQGHWIALLKNPKPRTRLSQVLPTPLFLIFLILLKVH